MGGPSDNPLHLTQGQQLMTNVLSNLYKGKNDCSSTESFSGDGNVMYLDCGVSH